VVRLETRVKELTQHVTQLMEMRDDLMDETVELKSENKKLKTTRDMEDEQIAHKLKMREETCDMNYNKKLIKKDEECANAIAAVKDTYRDKTEKQLEKRGDELKNMYGQILKRLPDVNMAITKEIKDD
jgi:DNA anti-recombination protein RmuC